MDTMYYNKVDICGINTSKLKVLSAEEKNELLKKVKNGDRKAREELIDGNLRLVLSIIQRFGGKVRDADDLFQVGCVGRHNNRIAYIHITAVSGTYERAFG